MNIVIAYEDGRRFETTEDGYHAYHAPFGATVVGFVGADGKTYGADEAGRAQAAAAVDPLDNAVVRQTAALQARAAAEPTPEVVAPPTVPLVTPSDDGIGTPEATAFEAPPDTSLANERRAALFRQR